MVFGAEARVSAAFVDSPFANLPEIMSTELARNGYPPLLVTPAVLMARIVGEIIYPLTARLNYFHWIAGIENIPYDRLGRLRIASGATMFEHAFRDLVYLVMRTDQFRNFECDIITGPH